VRNQLGLHLVLIELFLILSTVFGSNVFTQDEAKMKAAIAHRPKKPPPPNPELELGDGKFKWLTLPDPMNIDIYAVPEQPTVRSRSRRVRTFVRCASNPILAQPMTAYGLLRNSAQHPPNGSA